MKLPRLALFAVLSAIPLLLTLPGAGGQSPAAKGSGAPAPLTSQSSSGLAFRGIGPALTSGRIAAIAIDPRDSNVWYVAAAAGGLWKTTDGGTSFKCVTDNLGSFSMGAVAVDPVNSQVIWLGTGEQQSQRSVDFGDGVYRSADGGNTWTNMGLTRSEHIARIVIDPRNSEVVYVAAQGPLWSPGGDRGVFKSDRRRQNLAVRCFKSAKTRASPISSWTRAIPTFSMPLLSSGGGIPAWRSAAGRSAGFLNRKTPASPGPS